MRDALWFKFRNNDNLKKMLLGTGDAVLVEDSPIDDYWGIGENGDGQNMLGKLLMELRSKLAQKKLEHDLKKMKGSIKPRDKKEPFRDEI